MRIASALSVTLSALLLAGCVAPKVAIEPDASPRGQILGRAGRPGFVVAAPHGSSDLQTADIASEIARHTGFGLVVARGFSIESDASGRTGRRYHVNRPLEGAPGASASDEQPSADARAVFDQYERRVREISAGPLAFYVEIHGNARPDSAERIEVATVGVDRESAYQLRTLYELTRDAHLRAQKNAPRLAMLIEPVDKIFYTASATKRDGILRLPQRALHIELPRAARVEWRDLYTAILADFVGEAASLRPLRAPR